MDRHPSSSSEQHHMVSPLTCVLEESLFKLELLKLICHNDESSLLLILGDKRDRSSSNNTTANKSVECMQTMNVLMEEYLSILSDPDLEWTSNTITSLDDIKQTLNIHFHQIYIECMKKINKTSLNIEEIIGLKQEYSQTSQAENGCTIKYIKEKWEKVCNAFIQYLNLSTNSFKELSAQYQSVQSAETAQDCINKLILEYKHKRQECDDLESVLQRERSHREHVRKEMMFNIDKLQNDFDCLTKQYEDGENAMNDHQINTMKNQTQSHEKAVVDLNNQIDKSCADLIKAKEANCELECEIKKKVKRMELEIEEIKSKYNMDMISIHKESDKLQKLNESETNRLNELQVKIDGLNTIRQEHEILLKEQRKKEEELKQICEKAAIRIQKLWRGHSVRKANKKKKKENKKKKDKKKKN